MNNTGPYIKPDAPVPEILTVDKPVGVTSFGVVGYVRRLLREAGHANVKVGHAGTLDPLASGLMILGIGKGTKQLATLIKLDKTYEAHIILGEQRTTGDMEGEIIAAIDVLLTPELEKRIETAAASLVGTHELPVPAFSAIKRDGVPLYKRARRGQHVDVPLKKMRVDAWTITDIFAEDGRVHVRATIAVGSGTYIRSLAEEMGRRLGLPATLGGLRRTIVGDYTLEGALSMPSKKPTSAM
ncbi:MAG: hypothetical protein RL150_276 [Candidatus Parcubacteria bacterium]